ncbi:hypothetical protein HZS_5223 [Henneguya salminicola]|nr:hypothetical protein HZS_5223 [Henneguya salminicola]
MTNILFQTGLFLSFIARKHIYELTKYDEERVTTCFRILKKAAGIFLKCGKVSRNFLKETFNNDNNTKPSDMDFRVIDGHCNQCLAEAMECIFN